MRLAAGLGGTQMTQPRQQYHNTVGIADAALAQDRHARSAGRSEELCALVQIRRRRQRAAVRGHQHPPQPQRDAELRRHRGTARRSHRSRPGPGQDRRASAPAWPARSTRSCATLEVAEDAASHYSRDLVDAAQRLASTVDRADVRAVIEALAQATRSQRRKTRGCRRSCRRCRRRSRSFAARSSTCAPKARPIP